MAAADVLSGFVTAHTLPPEGRACALLHQPGGQEGRKDLLLVPQGLGLSPGAGGKETGQHEQTWPRQNSLRVTLALRD